tara:strand:+ start:6144 stop:6320 length:177 start_codon:yes stop_codon:yes gene_type:complete
MYLRNYKGKIVFIDEKKYTSDKELYILIWKTKYNIDISKKTDNIENLLEYVNGHKFFV